MVATNPNLPPPPAPPCMRPREERPARTSSLIADMEEDLVRFNRALDYLETHGDDDTFGIVSMMRPFATSLDNRLGDLRSQFSGKTDPR